MPTNFGDTNVVSLLRLSLLVLTVFSVTASALRPQSPAPPRTAVLRLRVGLDANPKTTSKYQRRDWAESIRLMRATGANHFHYAKVWSEVERRAGTYDTSDVRFMIQESASLPVAFNLRVVDAGARNMPEEYKALAWDSAEMIGHISSVVDQLAPVLGIRPWSYAIGNEIDLYFASRPQEIGAYARMLEQVKTRVLRQHPAARFTTSFQFTAASQLRSLYVPIVSALDHVAFTYYPLAADFRVRPETSVGPDLQTMIAAAVPRPIFLQEIGYPSAGLLGSSPDRQRAFVQLAFEAIRAVGSSRVLGATYLFQADFPEWVVNDIARVYGENSETFRAFITTLGLRDERDRPKPGWDEFVRQARLIGPPTPPP
jgi:hypothetical protein